MAKLEAVKTVAESIEYGGKTYVKTDEAAQVGDIVRCEDDDYEDSERGDFFIAEDGVDADVDSPVITDNAGDEISPFGMFPEDWSVFRVMADENVAPTPAADKLPQDYVIHDGAIYRKEARVAVVGELAYRTRDCISTKTGDVVKAVRMGGYCPIADDNVSLFDDNHVALVPTDTVTIGDVDYGVEKRRANVGETVLVVQTFHYGKAGEIGVVQSSNPHGRDVVTDKHALMNDGRYVVLTPKAAVEPEAPTQPAQPTPTYREVERKANVGERIRIVNVWIGEKRYEKGAEFVVSKAREWDGYVNVDEIGERVIAYSEYVVLEPVEREYQPGDKVRSKTGEPAWHTTLTEHAPQFDGIYGKAWHHTHDHGWLGEDQFELVEAAEEQAVEPQPKRLAVGDYVKVTDTKSINGRERDNVKLGEIRKIIECDGSSLPFSAEELDGSDFEWFRADALVPATDEEVNVARAGAERKAGAAKWAALGRKVNEYKTGDIVTIIEYQGGDKANSIVRVNEVGDTFVHYDSVDIRIGTFRACKVAIELVAPVETLFNR